MRAVDRQPWMSVCLPRHGARMALPDGGEGTWLPRWYNLDIVLNDDFPRV